MTREEWLRHAVETLDEVVFQGDLDILNHGYQIGCGKCPGKKLTECVQPFDGEDVKLEDFFPTTISVSYTIKDPIEMLGNLALECIHAFFNEKKVNKKFKKLAEKYYFDTPYTSYHPTPYLKDLLKDVYARMKKEYGEFPGKPVVFHPKEKKEGKKNTLVFFCPSCGFELKASRKEVEKHGNGCPTCPCGTKMGIDYGDESESTESQDS